MIKYLGLLFLYIEICAQTLQVSGRVSDAQGNFLPGVNVVVQGLNTGDAANNVGEYIIKGLKPGNYTLIFSNIGYKSVAKNIELTKNYILNVVLETEAVISEQIIVTAGKHSQRFDELPVSAALIENKTLMRFNYNNIREAMKYVPGLNMVEDQLSIRGSSGYSRGAGTRVLVAIDGLPFYTGDTGEIIWEAIPVNEIDRVEIIKGASSSLYGSTAIGGVVNLLTKETSEPFTYIKTFLGYYGTPSHDSWDWSNEFRQYNGQMISHSNSFGNLSFTASFTRLEDLGYRLNNFNKRYIGYLKTSFRFSDNSSLKVFFNSMNQKSGNFIYWKNSTYALQPPDEDVGQTVKSDRYMVGLVSENHLTEQFFLYIRSSYYGTFWSDETASNNKSDADQFRGEIQSNFRVNKNLLLTSGFELNSSKVSSSLFGAPESQGTGVYAQADISFNFPLSASAGLRYDYNKVQNYSSNSALSPKAGINYKLNDKVSFRSMIGTGFRAPSLAEKFTSTFVSGVTIKPNPNIEPESNVTFEAGFLYQDNFLLLDASIFRNNYYDMIETFIDPSDGQVTFKNLVRARIQGIEVNLTPELQENFDIRFSYTYMDPKDLNTGKTLKYRPRHLFYSSVNIGISGWEAGVNFRYSSRIDEIDQELVDLGIVPDGDKRVSVYVLDFNAGYNFIYIDFPARIYVNLKNLLNYNYIELIGNIAPIRNIAISFELFL